MRPTAHRPRRAAVRPTVMLTASLVALLGALPAWGARPVAAHTDLDFTIPTDGAAVGEPVDEITIGFTEAVTLVGPGFEVLDPQGNVVTPFAATDDDQVFRLQLDPPLAGGEAAVRYEVRAQDGHTVTGGFSFTISVAALTSTSSTTSPATTSLPETSEPTVTSSPPTTPAPTSTTSTIQTVAATSPPTSPPTSGAIEPGGERSNTVYLAISAAVAIGAAAFLLVRSRSSPGG